MIPVGSEIFVQDPNCNESRRLCSGRVVEQRDRSLTIELDRGAPEFSAGDEAMVFFDRRGEFVQAPARIDAVLTTSPDASGDGGTCSHPVLNLQLTDDPVSAESREYYRVSTVLADLTATIDNEADCKLVDVSTTGLAIISGQSLRNGQTVNVTLNDGNGQTFSGKACVQSVRELKPGRLRCGMRCVSDRREGGNLAVGLQRISMDMQRQQLKRRTGAA